VSIQKGVTPDAISKLDGKRTLHVYADLFRPETARDIPTDAGSRSGQGNGRPGESRAARETTPVPTASLLDLPRVMTPLEIADHLEKNLFPRLQREFPTTELSFGGEIAETRESGSDFIIAIAIVVVIIFVILALTFNSLLKPFLILAAIPFGVVGVILTLQVHGILMYSFFTVVGALGLAGVVVNDSIVLVDKLEREYDDPAHGSTPREKVASITKTRLRAVLLTTVTTVAALLPTAYGIFGYDSMLSDMMLVMAWGLIFGTVITLILVPSLYCLVKEIQEIVRRKSNG